MAARAPLVGAALSKAVFWLTAVPSGAGAGAPPPPLPPSPAAMPDGLVATYVGPRPPRSRRRVLHASAACLQHSFFFVGNSARKQGKTITEVLSNTGVSPAGVCNICGG